MKTQPSLINILTTDYSAFSSFIFLPVLLIIVPILMWIYGQTKIDYIFLLYIAVVSVISVMIAVGRCQTVRTAFKYGTEVQAVINNVLCIRDRISVNYIYQFEGQKYLSGNIVMKNKRTRDIKIGEEVVVVIDPYHTKRAFVRDFYLDRDASE